MYQQSDVRETEAGSDHFFVIQVAIQCGLGIWQGVVKGEPVSYSHNHVFSAKVLLEFLKRVPGIRFQMIVVHLREL
jgi:hypothetical protein